MKAKHILSMRASQLNIYSKPEVKTSENSSCGHVVMLVNNPCINDSRVIKSAEAIASDGWHVSVVCRQAKGKDSYEKINGVIYYRLNHTSKTNSSPKTFHASEKIRILPIRAVQYFSGLKNRVLFIEKNFRRFFYLKNKTVRVIKNNFRRSARFFTYLPRKVYWFLEPDEFRCLVLDFVLSIKPDVIHCHDLATLPTGTAIAKKTQAKLVYDSHELEMHRNAKHSILTQNKRRRNEKTNIVKANTVITVSDSIADHLMLDYQIPRPHVIMNAPVLLQNIESSHNIRDMIGLRNSDSLAVYVGSVTINRGLDFVIRALQYCSDLHLAMVGPRRPQTHEELEILADKLNVSNRIHFIDPVNPKEVVGFIKTANVSVIPIQNVCLSYYYSMPNKLLESVFAGIPVVVSNLIEIKRFVQRYRCGEVMDQTNPESIAEAIEKVINHSDKYKIAAHLMADLNRCYSWESQAERLKKIYASFRNLN